MDSFHRVAANAILVLVVLLVVCPSALSQEQTTATYGDWTLLCAKQAPTPGHPSCEVGQQLAIPDENKRPTLIGYVAIGRSGQPPTNTIAVKLPLGVSLPVNTVISGTASKLQIVLPYRYCLPDGCVAIASLDEGQLSLLRGSNKPMDIAFDILQNNVSRKVQLRVSLSGLTAALKALDAQK
jgi:invasion protein IalB